VVSKIPQRTSHSLEYNVRLAQIAEENGFEFALTQIRFLAGYGAEEQHEVSPPFHRKLIISECLVLPRYSRQNRTSTGHCSHTAGTMESDHRCQDLSRYQSVHQWADSGQRRIWLVQAGVHINRRAMA